MIYHKDKKIENINHIYIHCPFCLSKCSYCDFYSEEIDPNYVNSYVDKLIEEFLFFRDYIRDIKSIYFGGGTPYLLGIKNLERVLNFFTASLSSDCEITIELNPHHYNHDNNFLENLKSIGFNRYSLGIQSFNKKLLKKLNRIVPENFLEFLEKNHNKNISLDFMFAVPSQTLKDLDAELDLILKLKPKHLSFYLFTPPKNTNFVVPKIPIQEKMFFLIKEKLKDYSHYEVSNYALKNYESIHNLAYWERKTYLGFGASAHSFVICNNKGIRYSNPCSYLDYIKNPMQIEFQENLDEKAINNEKIFLGLRLLNQGVENLFINKEINSLIKEGVLIKTKDKIFVKTDKLFLIDEITSRIISA